jgi:hypothetical protein
MAGKGSLFDVVLENSMNVGLQSNLKKSIENAGIHVPAETCLWQYPEIIRKNLVSKTVTGINILGGDVINIDTSSDGEVVTYNLSTVFDTYGVPRPNYAGTNNKWGKEITVKDVFDDLFSNILPAVRGVYAGDMTISNLAGEDTQEWNHKLFGQTGLKKGLEPTARYIRLYLTCQPEPIYVNIGNLVEEITNGYNVASSDTVIFEVDDMNNTLSAHVNVINKKQLQDLGIVAKDKVTE